MYNPNAPQLPPPPLMGPPAPISASGVNQVPSPSILEQIAGILQATANAPSNALYTLPGNVLQGVGATSQGGREGFFDFLQKTLNDSTAGAANSQMLGPWGGFAHSLGQLSPGLQRVGLEALGDPLNLVGAGVPKGALLARALEAGGVARSTEAARAAVAAGQNLPTIAEAALKAGITPAEMESRLMAQYGGQGASLLRGAMRADEGVQRVGGALMGPALGAMAGGAVGGLPGAVVGAGAGALGPRRILERVPAFGRDVPEMVNDVMTTRPAQNAYDLITSKTRHSYYKARLGDLENAVQVLLANGHDLGTDVLDHTSPSIAKFDNWTDAYHQVNNLYNDLTQSVRNTDDPHTKIAGLEAVKQAEQRLYSIWEGVSVARQQAIDRGDSAADVELATNTALTSGWTQMYHVLGAARDVVQSIERGATDRLPLDPAVEQTIAQASDQAMRQIHGLRGGLRTLGTSLPRDAIVRLGEVQQRQLAGVRYRTDQAQSVIDQAFQGIGQQMPELGDQVAGQFQRRFNSLMHLQSGLRDSLSTELPSKFTGPLREDFQDFADKYASIVRDRGKFENAIGELWGRYMPQDTPMPSLTGATPKEWWANINNTLNTISQTTGQPLLTGGNAVSDTMGLRDILVPRVSAETAAALDGVVQRWGKADILSDEPYRAAFDRVARALRPKFGITDPKPGTPAAMYQWWENNLLQPWKASQLMSLAYPISNALGIVTNSALEGVSPLRIFQNLRRTIGPRLRGEEGQLGTHAVYTPDAMDMYRELGITAPVQTQNGSALLADLTPTGRFTGAGQSAIDRWGAGPLAIAGGIGGAAAGALTPGDPDNRAQNIGIGTLAGAGIGAATPTVAKFIVQRLSAALESAARETAWVTGVNRHLDQTGALELQNIVESALRGNNREGLQINDVGTWVPKGTLDEAQVSSVTGPDLLFRGNPAPPGVQAAVDARYPMQFQPPNLLPGRNPTLPIPNPAITMRPPDARVLTHGMTPDEADQLMNAIASHRGRISQADLEETLRLAGVNPDTAREAGMQWGNHLQAASDKGLNLANTINFNYEDLNNLEQAVKTVSPFATWGLKAYPFFAKNLAAHPVLADAVLNLMDQSRKEQKAKGLTGRFNGTIEFNGVSDLLSRMLGREEHANFNPLNALVPFSDIGSLQSMNENEGLVSNLMDLSNAFGFGVRPEIQTALRASGALGDAPATGYLRPAAFVKGVTGLLGVNSGRGIDLNAPFIAAERGIRGRDNTPNLEESAITRKIDELAIRAVGVPTSTNDVRVGAFTAAKVMGKGPIWDEAAREVTQEQAARAIPGFLAGQAFTPRALASGEELKIRGARHEGLSLTSDQSGQLAEQAVKNPNAMADPLITQQVTRASVALSIENGHDGLPEQVATLLANPTAANVNQVQRWVYEMEAYKSPLIQGYSGGGNERAARLSNVLSMYNNPAALALADPNSLGMSQDQLKNLLTNIEAGRLLRRTNGATGRITPVAGALNENKAMRDAMSNAFPDLAQYLAWRQMGGQGGPDEFIASLGR